MIVLTAPVPRETGPAGTVTSSVPVDETVNVTGVSSLGPGPFCDSAIVSARVDVAAPAGKAEAMMSAPHAATPPAVMRNSGLCMVFPP